WVREDVDELSHKPFQDGISDYLVGTIILILSEVIIFGVLFTFYFWSRAHASGDFYPEFFPHGATLQPIILNTVILLSSGGTVHMAQLALKKDQIRKFRVWLGATILLASRSSSARPSNTATSSARGSRRAPRCSARRSSPSRACTACTSWRASSRSRRFGASRGPASSARSAPAAS